MKNTHEIRCNIGGATCAPENPRDKGSKKLLAENLKKFHLLANIVECKTGVIEPLLEKIRAHFTGRKPSHATVTTRVFSIFIGICHTIDSKADNCKDSEKFSVHWIEDWGVWYRELEEGQAENHWLPCTLLTHFSPSVTACIGLLSHLRVYFARIRSAFTPMCPYAESREPSCTCTSALQIYTRITP